MHDTQPPANTSQLHNPVESYWEKGNSSPVKFNLFHMKNLLASNLCVEHWGSPSPEGIWSWEWPWHHRKCHAPIEVIKGSVTDFTWHQKCALDKDLWCLQLNENIWINCSWRDVFSRSIQSTFAYFQGIRFYPEIFDVYIRASSTICWEFK